MHTIRRTAALLCAALAGLALAGPLRAQSPVGDPNPSPAAPTPYSSPNFHSGGEFTPPSFLNPLPVPFPDPLYSQLQGTPTGLVPGTGANAGTYVSTEFPSFLLGNYLPGSPPAAPGFYFPNHFRDGTASSWSAPLTFTMPNAAAPTPLASGAQPLVTVESTPTAVNSTEFPFIQNMQYVGTITNTAATADPTLYPGSTTPGLHHGGVLTTPYAAPAATPYLIRQVVYFGRVENTVTTTGSGPSLVTTNTPVGAVYCVDGFTGEVIWRYQTASVEKSDTRAVLRDPTVFSAPTVAYMNVLTNAVTGVYANKAVVIVTDNNGFVYCLDATGNGDGTSNVDATTGGDRTTGSGATPTYGAQPVYPSTTSTTTGAHLGTTAVYWIWRPDAEAPHSSATSSINFDPQTVLPVPGPFGLASANVYINHSVPTVPDANGKLASNAVVYLGNTRDCVYALDGLGVPNYRKLTTTTPLPAYNASLLPIITAVPYPVATTVTTIPDAVPTVNPRWWFTPDNASNTGLSFESTPAIAPPAAPFPAAVIVTASANPVPLTPATPVTFKATVSDGTGNGGQPTGTVIFTVDGAAQAAVPVTAGVATSAPVTFTTGGPHTVTAAYSGDGTFTANTNTPAFDEEVESGVAGSTSTVLTSSLNPSAPNQLVTFTATVTDGVTGLGVAVGTVTFTVSGVAQTPVPVAAGVATLPATALIAPGSETVTATYNPVTPYTTSTTSFQQYVYKLLGPTVYIGSSQENGAGSNAGRLYAIDGFSGPTLARNFGGTGHTFDQRPKWAFPNAYADGGIATPGNPARLPSRPALGNITGSPVVFTNLDAADSIATGTFGTPGYVPAQYRTRIYFAADTGLEVPYTATTSQQPNPRPATDTTGRVWSVNPNGSTALVKNPANSLYEPWSFPQANDPNDATKDNTHEVSPPIGAFLHSTPAIGVVQFPATIQYGAAGALQPYLHADTVNTDVKGKSVPMLYVGTDGAADLGFYALDIDGGNDTQRSVYRLESPTGSAFESSPVLVTNSSTVGGNGGAVYATAGNDLLQITATPISNVNTAQAFAFVGVDATFGGGGPISGPAVAAANTADLTQTFTTFGGANATDWVYFGDGTLGFCRAITPSDPNYLGIPSPAQYGLPMETNAPPLYSNKFFLQAYLFDGSAAHKATDTNMGNALGLNQPISGFDWGGFSYVRLGNVVPPGFNPAAPDPSLLVADPTDSTLFYGNGGAVSFSIGSASALVPPTTLTALTGSYPESGFIHRSDTPAAGDQTQLVTPSGTGAGTGWIAAYSYPIGADQTRIGDTPGAFRRVRQANQTATVYTAMTSGGVTTYTATGTISLDMQTGIGSQYLATDAAGNKSIKQTPPIEQPTFGILNPLAVQGMGVTLPTNGTSSVQPVTSLHEAGPFGKANPASTMPSLDFAAFANGSNYIPSLPKSGYDVTKENPTSVNQFITDQAAYAQIPISIATSVGDVVDGTVGTNLVDPVNGTYGLQVQNRSLVGTYTGASNPFSAIPVAMQSVVAHWNDNTSYGTGGPPQNDPGGPGATINPLPWEDFNALSSVNANASLDYPDIPASAITHSLIATSGGGSLNSGNGSVTLDLTTGPVSQPTYTTDHVKISVAVPAHQPANLQVWDGSAKIPTTPAGMILTNHIFPHGYIEGSGTGAGNSVGGGTPQRVFVDLSGRGQYNTIYPYRDVQSFAGVPVNMKTTIQDGTINLENAPSALGLQTEQSAAGLNLGLFDPYNPNYQTFFKPVTVHNEGNVNLLNVHFNQQMTTAGAGGTANSTLNAYSDGNDPLSFFGGFDYNGTAGPVSGFQRTMPNGTAINLLGAAPTDTQPYEQAFLFRTSLDSDLVQAYGRNSALPFGLYPAATFHKPRAGSDQPTTLTVPDVPENGDPTYTPPSTVMPTPGSTSLPYVGMALPFGTPVGTYHTLDQVPLRVFEGLDTSTASPFQPPTYGSKIGGHFSPNPATLTTQLALDPTTNAALAPVSNPGLTLQIKVLEDRLTDGFTFGALPMIDGAQAVPASGATAAQSTPDFAPAAFRDPGGKSLSVYWTSGRTAGAYNIYGVNVPFDGNSNYGSFFTPKSGAASWYGPVGTLNRAPGTNSGMSIETGPATATSAFTPRMTFDVATMNAPYTNVLYSYELSPANGSLFSFQRITPKSSDSQVKYGIKGLSTAGSGFTNNVWAFWTGTTRGRNALYYSPQSAWNVNTAPALLPVPAGLTAVSDASPLLMPDAPLSTGFGPVIEVTYSGTGPDGNADLYASRYLPGTTATTANQLNLVPFSPVTENLRPTVGGWYQARDVAWSRTGALNLTVPVADPVAGTPTTSLLYGTAAPYAPKFTKAIYDKASGFLVLTGVRVPIINPPAGTLTTTTNTVYVDAATGRVRFSPALLATTQNFAPIRATFSPLARRLTIDSRADVGPVTFLDTAQKPNDTPTLPALKADRRWTIWRKSGTAGIPGSATLYYKTQRLTYFLPTPIGVNPTNGGVLLSSIKLNGTDVTNSVDVDYVRGRIYFPNASDAEGQYNVVVTYAQPGTVTNTAPTGTNTTTTPSPDNTVQWQDEFLANDTADVPPADSAAGLDTVIDNTVPITTATNENNVAAFLDPLAGQIGVNGLMNPHKVWLFWNSTRNGTADIYSETIDPLFAPVALGP